MKLTPGLERLLRLFLLTESAGGSCAASLQGLSAFSWNGLPQACSDTALAARRPVHTLDSNMMHLSETIRASVAVLQPVKNSHLMRQAFMRPKQAA